MSASSTTPAAPRRAVWSWITYDLANTIFSLNIVSMFFSVWVVNVMGGSDSLYATANGAAMLVIFLLSPLLGALTDQAPRRMPFLIVATIGCVAATLLLGRVGLTGSLIAFAVAVVMYQAGLQFYDSLLPVVSTPANRGRIGGLGIAVGYLGSVIGLTMGRAVLASSDSGESGTGGDPYVLIFTLSAALFLFFALPCFVFVREPARPTRFDAGSLPRALRQVVHTLRSAPRHPGLVRFLVGRAFYTDAVNTVIVFMTIYVTNAVGFTAGQATTVMLIAILCAALGGLIWGRVVDRVGPIRTLHLVLGVWVVVFTWAAVVGFAGLPPATFWPVPVLAGLALGGTWSADRPLMLLLSPPDRVGEFYGLYGMVGRFSAIVGPILWAVVSEGLGLGRPAAVASLLVFILAAIMILRPLAGEIERARESSA